MASLRDLQNSSLFLGCSGHHNSFSKAGWDPLSGCVLSWQHEKQLEESTVPPQALREGWCQQRGQPHLMPGGTPSPCASWLPPPGGKMFLCGAKTASWREHYCLFGESPVPEEAAVYQFCPHHSTQSVCAVRGIDGVGKAPKTI